MRNLSSFDLKQVTGGQSEEIFQFSKPNAVNRFCWNTTGTALDAFFNNVITSTQYFYTQSLYCSPYEMNVIADVISTTPLKPGDSYYWEAT